MLPPNLHVSQHPAVLHKLGILRDEKTEPKKFREVVRELSWLLGYEALADAGTKGFWMGYFGHRAAPMGAVSPGVVEATFFNFAPSRVQRAVPDVFEGLDPDDRKARRDLVPAAQPPVVGVFVSHAAPAVGATASTMSRRGR